MDIYESCCCRKQEGPGGAAGFLAV
ncbi:hypothetical protein CCACVL1_14020 [Corchorus capsularis]|uniref:Uncharacterized protein n=1 Tax=Corchorus capsularis TaxID=210143 RepID=A0A1R3I8K6_COCAP|nr:hypothetical protein CCACVL1_14020 [Corchorus capsularis]